MHSKKWRYSDNARPGAPQLGLRKNWSQFLVFTFITLLIGTTIGVERVALPPLAKQAFGISSVLYTVSFIAAFGLVKAVMNLVSGRLSDNRGRKTLLLVGWAFAIPFALLIIFAQSWWWVVVANLFLGVNQGLTWTMSVTAKIDLTGPENRGLAVGIDESAGYVGVGIGSFTAGLLVSSFGLRPAPYLLALGVVGLGTAVTIALAKETLPWAAIESASRRKSHDKAQVIPRLSRLAGYMSWQDKTMLAVCQAGFFNKFVDSLVIGFLPLYFLQKGLHIATVGLIVGVYAWVWGLSQVGTGALADRIGRKRPIYGGTFLLAAGTAGVLLTGGTAAWLISSAIMGIGMALVYPNLISAVSDVAHPAWRGGALGIYRLWRDGGYAIGPLALGTISLFGGVTAALWAGVGITAASGLFVLIAFEETEPRRRTRLPKWEDDPDWALADHQPINR